MGEARGTNPLVEQFRRGGVPRDLRLIAAQGSLPLKPTDVVELLELLLSDRDEEIRNTASNSLMNFSLPQLALIARDRATPTGVLAWCLFNRKERELREILLQNPSTPDEAVEAAVGTLPEELNELVVINQVRLLRRTSLLAALESSSLNNDQRRRLRELRETFHIGEVTPEPQPAPVAPTEEPLAAEAPEDDLAIPEFQSEEEAVIHILDEDERNAEKISAVQRIYRLSTADKVITALRGSREERGILVRDPNRLVSTAVLGSPRLTEAEVESFAAMKNISDEILRKIGTNKDWTKRYTVVSSLVRNPKTPLAISLGMVSRLNPKDLKSIAVDRNVPDVIRNQAQRFVRSVSAGPGEKKR